MWKCATPVVLLATVATGQTEESAWTRPRLHDWSVSFEARAWYQSPGGDLTMPGGAVSGENIDLDELNMDSPKLSPFGKLRFQRDKLRIGLSGSQFSADRSSTVGSAQTIGDVPIYAGERSNLDFSHWSLETDAMYEVFSYVDGSTTDGRDEVRLRGLLGGGLRATNVGIDFDVTPTDASRSGLEPVHVGYDGTFVELIAAASLEIDLYEKWFISVDVSGGGFGLDGRSASSLAIEPTFTWHPSSRVGVEVGYRMLIHRLEDGDAPAQFEWNGSMAGVFAGVSVRF